MISCQWFVCSIYVTEGGKFTFQWVPLIRFYLKKDWNNFNFPLKKFCQANVIRDNFWKHIFFKWGLGVNFTLHYWLYTLNPLSGTSMSHSPWCWKWACFSPVDSFKMHEFSSFLNRSTKHYRSPIQFTNDNNFRHSHII